MRKQLVTILSFATVASAHFVFVVPQPDGTTAKVFISEDLKPTDEVDVGLVGGTKLMLRDAEGHESPLALTKGNQAYTITFSGSGPRLIHGITDLGLTQRGQEKPYLLVYYPKTILGDAFDPKTIVGGGAPVEIVPIGSVGALRLKVLAHEKPLPKTEVTVILPDGTQKKLMTDLSGITEVLPQTGRFGAWARYWETVGGERDGKSYAETRNYATLVFDAPGSTTTATQFAILPEKTSSFGAVASDGWLYVYGGHIAPTHSYSTDAVSGHFARIRLSAPKNWEELPGGPGLQGMNLAEHKGKIYRIGGMTPRNKPGEPSAIYSVPDCARFDPATLKWETLPALPEPRSSHDVVVIGDKLIVVGGWALKGPAATEWLDSLAILDLAADRPEWKIEKQPFKRRALIAAARSGKMYVLGGFDEHGKIIKEVSIYDPGTGVWTKGPALPGNEIDGFSPAACVHGNSLYVSVADGGLYWLDESKQQWEKAGSATPRVAHRIVSESNTILVIGGADKGKNSDLIEAVRAGN